MKTDKATQFSSHIIRASFGSIAIIWRVDNKPKIWRIIINSPNDDIEKRLKSFFPGVESGVQDETSEVIDKFEAFLNGASFEFSLDNLILDICPSFQRRVLLEVYAIPKGKVSSYGSIAKRLNSPKAGRAIGAAMAKNPFPIVIPCHRVIRSDGSLGGYGGGIAMKRKLLEIEGVEFCGENHVAEKCFY